jgi:hypothetical protein
MRRMCLQVEECMQQECIGISIGKRCDNAKQLAAWERLRASACAGCACGWEMHALMQQVCS